MIWPDLVDPIMILKDGTFSRKTPDPEKRSFEDGA